MTTNNRMPNRLLQEKSPYLLQHAYNPVDWYPWGPEAFARAVSEDKPIFLSIGYSTCHWCHIIIMNQNCFNPINLKIHTKRSLCSFFFYS